MRIVIAGAGDIGTYLARMLSRENHDIVVIDLDEDKLKNIESSYDLLTVQGSAASIEVLTEASIKKADLYIAVTEAEETNVLSSILSKKLGAKKTIARIDNQEYLKFENKNYFTKLGIDSLIYPEILASKEIVSLLKQSGTTQAYDFSGGKLSLFAIKLEEHAPIVNKTLIEVANEIQTFDFRAVALIRNSETLIPHGNDIFQLNDLVYVITNQAGVKNLLKYSGIENVQLKNLMILGGSRIAVKTARMLEENYNVKLIEIDRDKCLYLADYLPNTLIINGDGRNNDLLLEEGIEKIDAFIAVTGNAETNILSSLLAKKYGVKKIIAEIENIEYIELANNIGIDTIINKKSIAASHIFSFTMDAEVSAVQWLNETKAEVLEFVAHENCKASLAAIKNIDFPKGAIIGGIIRGKLGHIAKGDTVIKANDKVVVFALPAAIKAVERFFQ